MADETEDTGANTEAPEAAESTEAPAAPEADGGDEMAAAMEEQAAEESAEASADGGEPAAGSDSSVELEELGGTSATADAGEPGDDEQAVHSAAELEPVYDVPVNVQAVLGKAHLEVSQLLKLGPGAIVELDRKVGEAIDIYVNDRLVARGEVILVEDHLGVTMTEIIKSNNA